MPLISAHFVESSHQKCKITAMVIKLDIALVIQNIRVWVCFNTAHSSAVTTEFKIMKYLVVHCTFEPREALML